MTTSIRSEATRSVVVVNGVDQMAINQNGKVQLLVPNNTPTGNDVVSAVNFNSSLSGNGYQKLPSGLIIQWGTTTTISAENSLVVTLPVAFPTAGLVASATPKRSAAGSVSASAYAEITSNSQITITYDGSGTTPPAAPVYWLAIGN